MKKKLAWVCLIVSPVLLGGAAFSPTDRDPISLANCHKIKKGMTEKEVEFLLGREKDDFWGGDCWWGKPECRWEGARGKIIVEVDIVDIAASWALVFGAVVADPPFIVESARFLPSPPRSVVEKFKRFLGL